MTTLVPLWIGGTGVDATASAVTFNNGVIVDDINLDGKVITMTGDTSDTFTITVAAAGFTTIATTDAAGTDGHLLLDIDGALIIDAGDSIGQVQVKKAGTEYLRIFKSGSPATIHSIVSDADLVLSGNDGGSTINALTLDMSENGAATFLDDVTVGDDLKLSSDDAMLFFGAGNEVRFEHDHNSGLSLTNLASSDGASVTLTLKNSETDIEQDDVIGAINFQSPQEAAGTDAILVSAGIEAVSEGDFSATNNATKLSFKTAASEVAAEKMSLSSAGLLTIADSFVIKDAGNIGSASDTDAIAISSGGVVTFSQAPVFPNGSIDLADLDIDGGTDIGEAIVDADLFIIDNGAGGTNRKTAASRLKTYISAGTTVALDDITTGDAASTLATSAGNITIDAQGDDTDIIFKGTDGGADTTFLTIDGSEAGAAVFNSYLKSTNYFWMNTDNGVALRFGTGAEIKITHVHDVGLTLTNTIADTDNRPFILQLKSEEDAIVADDVIASIELAAGDSGGTDAATVAAGIHAIAEGEFTASANPTKLVFTTGVSESAAASATPKMTLSSAGLLTIADDFIIKDGGTIGSATTAGAITIASGGGVTFSNAVTAAALTVDDINLNTKIITMTGSTNDTAVFTVGTNGTLSIVTTDTAGAAANIQITADGTAELAGTTVTLDSSSTIEINADDATTFFKDGSTAIAAVAGTPQAPGVIQNAGFVPVGSILAHGSTTVPTGWLDATAGAAVSRTTYSVLFAVLSTAYGAGDGSTTFNVPALGDRMIMGKGTNNGTVGASSTGASASFVVATASGSAVINKTTTTFASSAKDSATAVGLTNATAGGHTHNVTMPAQVCMYIIKA
jgi:microcystin-dependent protein